jgi:NAD(P)-dependent dehydrogenase (short-subunit alcohol dehydrogenase family)
MRLKDKVTFISGAGGGMGRVAALMFAQEGSKVVANDYRADAVKETVRMVRDAGGEAIAVPGDISVPSDVERAIAAGEKAFDYVNVLYNNAGIMPDKDESVLDLQEDVWRRVLDVNVKGLALGCQYGIPALLAGGAVWAGWHSDQRHLPRSHSHTAAGSTAVRPGQAGAAPQPHPNGPVWKSG